MEKALNKNTLNIMEFKNNRMSIHCDSDEKANDLLTLLNSFGITWNNNDSVINDNRWEKYKNKTCYSIDNGFLYIDRKYIINIDWTIYEWELLV